MNTTKILGEAVGIQSQGTLDKTETQTNEGLTSALIVGRFMRGRVDKPMTIHQGNIRGQLGYQPDNMDYIAVQDCLDTGVPSVQVLRVGPESNNFIISCDGATSEARFTNGSGIFDITVNDQLYENSSEWGLSYFILQTPSLNEIIEGNGDGDFIIATKSSGYLRIKLEPKDGTIWGTKVDNENPTVLIDQETGVIQFCLAPFK